MTYSFDRRLAGLMLRQRRPGRSTGPRQHRRPRPACPHRKRKTGSFSSQHSCHFRRKGQYRILFMLPAAVFSSTTICCAMEGVTMTEGPIITTHDLNLWYNDTHALESISMSVAKNRVTALIGPSGCGKSTLLRCFNRLNDLIDIVKITGRIMVSGRNIHEPGTDVVQLRKRVGMVFQKPNPFPKSVYENIAYGPSVHGIRDRAELDRIVEKSLRDAALWDEVRDRLHNSALGLSGGQQQRLCIARTLAVEPEVILMDEPCSALDPIATAKIENLIEMLKQDYSVI